MSDLDVISTYPTLYSWEVSRLNCEFSNFTFPI